MFYPPHMSVRVYCTYNTNTHAEAARRRNKKSHFFSHYCGAMFPIHILYYYYYNYHTLPTFLRNFTTWTKIYRG